MNCYKLNATTKKDHFFLSFIDQMLDRLAGKEFYCFLDGFYGYNKITIALGDWHNTTFTCSYGTFLFSHMPFCLCNAPGTFQMLRHVPRVSSHNPVEACRLNLYCVLLAR